MVGLQKRITLVKRDPAVGAAEFADLWCAAVRDRMDRSRRLALCPVRPGGPFDGVAIEWSATNQVPVEPPGVVEPGSSLTVVVEERTVNGEDWLQDRWSQSAPDPVPVLIGCIEPRPGLSRPDFRDYWWDQHRPLADRLVPTELAPVAYVHNYVRPDQPGPWAGIGELYEDSLERARARGQWFGSPAAQPLVEDEDRFLVRDSRLVLVAEHRIMVA